MTVFPFSYKFFFILQLIFASFFHLFTFLCLSLFFFKYFNISLKYLIIFPNNCMQFQIILQLFWSPVDLTPAALHSPAPVWTSWLLVGAWLLFWNFPLPLFSAEFSVSLILYIPVSWYTALIWQMHIFLYLFRFVCTASKVFESLDVWTFLYLKKIFFGCVGSLLLRVGFLWLGRAGATLCWGARASPCGDFSCCRAWAVGAQAQ